MLNENPSELKSDILKVGHHGSKTSSSQEFLQAVLPGYAVISVGRNNRYGHPHQEVLDRLKKFGIQIFRTDLNGDVVIESDGLAYKIK
jgi:beta-lactamase superfamily II metal-dependent hydrolase